MAAAFGIASINQLFDPKNDKIFLWKKFMFVIALINLSLDPLFIYVQTVRVSDFIIYLDFHLAANLAIFRTVTDLFQILGILVRFRTAYEDPTSKVFGKRRLIDNSKEIAVKYLKSNFILDFVAILPLPQAYIGHQILTSRISPGAFKVDPRIPVLLYITWFQAFPRFFVLIHSRSEITRAGILMKGAMSGAFYNLLSFVGVSNYMGALYYEFHIDWLTKCMKIVQKKGLETRNLDWDQLLSNCTKDDMIQQGMFTSILTNKIGTRNFIQKYMFCFSWGIKSLSSLGQNFSSSFNTLESITSIVVTLYGLILFADLITRMQAGIQSMEEREDQQRARQREVKEWMDYHQLPGNLKERVNLVIQSEWTENGIDDEVMLDSFPIDLRSEIRRYLYLDSVCKLPKFADMDSPLVEAICQCLKTFSGKEGTYILYEGDIVKQTFFIFNGQLELLFTDRGNSSITILGPGECCGQELLTWASLPTASMDNLPTSCWTIKCLTDVEAFVLQAYDMRILATQFAHNQYFQRAFKQHYP